MRRLGVFRYGHYVLLIILVYAVLIVWRYEVLRRWRTSKVSGVVIDISTNSPIELVPVRSRGRLTYTNFQGKFAWDLPRPFGEVRLEVPRNYETTNELMSCKVGQPTLLDQSFFCQSDLYPQPFEIASRVLNDEKSSQTVGERHEKLRALWNRLSSETQGVFGPVDDFVYLLAKKQEIDIKMSTDLVGFEVEEQAVVLDDYFDRVTQKDFVEVGSVSVVRHLADGSKIGGEEYFVRENGVWHYLPSFRLSEIRSFVGKHEWRLKVSR